MMQLEVVKYTLDGMRAFSWSPREQNFKAGRSVHQGAQVVN